MFPAQLQDFHPGPAPLSPLRSVKAAAEQKRYVLGVLRDR